MLLRCQADVRSTRCAFELMCLHPPKRPSLEESESRGPGPTVHKLLSDQDQGIIMARKMQSMLYLCIPEYLYLHPRVLK